MVVASKLVCYLYYLPFDLCKYSMQIAIYVVLLLLKLTQSKIYIGKVGPLLLQL